MIIRTLILCIISLGFMITLSAQEKTPDFAKYLVDIGAYREVIDLQLIASNNLSLLQEDSIDFYFAWSLFHLQRIPEAIKGFDKVSQNSSFYNQSEIFSSWCNLFSGKADDALRNIEKSPGELLFDTEVYRLQLSAIRLHQRKFELANYELSGILANDPFYTQTTRELTRLSREAFDFNPKSMVLAGILSGILPGAGKVYAGEKGAGISSFLILAGLGGIAAENIIKTGFSSWNSILFSSLFSIFYFGNVYGSMISIKTYRTRFNEGFDQALVATVLLPLRDYYR